MIFKGGNLLANHIWYDRFGMSLQLCGALLAGPLWWWVRPSSFTASLFWSMIIGGSLLRCLWGTVDLGMRAAWSAAIVGMSLNGAVIIMNGGYMPVVNPGQLTIRQGTWRLAQSTDRLLILADQPTLYWFSAGDMFIFLGGLLALMLIVIRKWKGRER